MLEKIDHIGIAVNSIAECRQFYEDVLGLKVTGVEEVAAQKVKVAFLPLGESKLELLETTEPGGAIAKFIAARGQGVHHIAIRVDNIEEELAALKEKGVRLIDEKPRHGAGGAKIAFIHPKESHGTLIELCEK